MSDQNNTNNPNYDPNKPLSSGWKSFSVKELAKLYEQNAINNDRAPASPPKWASSAAPTRNTSKWGTVKKLVSENKIVESPEQKADREAEELKQKEEELKRKEEEIRMKEELEKQRIKEEEEKARKRVEEEKLRMEEELKRKEQELQAKMEEMRQREAEVLRRLEEEKEALRLAELKKQQEEEERRRKEEEEEQKRRKQEEERRKEEELRRKEEEIARKAEELRRRQEEEERARQRELEEEERRKQRLEEMQKREAELAQIAEEMRRKEEELRQKEEERRKREQEDEIKRKEEEVRRREEELLRLAEEAKKREEELLRKQEELERRAQQEEDLKRKAEEVQRREEEAIRRGEEYLMKLRALEEERSSKQAEITKVENQSNDSELLARLSAELDIIIKKIDALTSLADNPSPSPSPLPQQQQRQQVVEFDDDDDNDDDDAEEKEEQMETHAPKQEILEFDEDEADDDEGDLVEPQTPQQPTQQQVEPAGEHTSDLQDNLTKALMAEEEEEEEAEAELASPAIAATTTTPTAASQTCVNAANEPPSPTIAPRAAEPAIPIPEHKYDIKMLPNPQWLKTRFDVIKYDPKAKFLSKKVRTWEVDFFEGCFRNMSRKGVVKKEHPPNKLLQIEKSPTDNLRLRMLFFGANHSYELNFNSVAERERFYECACAIRPKLFVWCPAIVKPGCDRSKTELCGSAEIQLYDARKKTMEHTITGKTAINVSAKPFENISVYCATWNMGNSAPPKDPRKLRALIPPGKHDIYCIGVQESGYSEKQEEFFAYIQSILGKDYVTLASQTLWDIRIIVLTRKRHLVKITNLEGEMKATGFMNICGNKGGVGIALRFNETSMLFLACHLAAHQERTSVRNTNVQEIVDGIKLGRKELDIFNQFHHVFWMGDMNYRIDLPYADGVRLAKEGNIQELLKYDQLKAQMQVGNVLRGFQEGPITFTPTYKYAPGSTEFDTKKQRTPSYTDRILWKSFPGTKIEQLSYNRCDTVLTSDHIPVYATFKVGTQRPFASVFCNPAPPVQIVFSGVYVTDRPSSEVIQKPNLVFYAPFLERHKNEKDGVCRTEKIAKSPNPRWKDSQIPALVPVTTHLEYLKTQHIILALRDGPEKEGSLEGLVGQTVISLRDACGDKPFEFSETMYLHGTKACMISGSVHIKRL